MAERTIPEPPRWYSVPEQITLPVTQIIEGPSSDEVAIEFTSNGGIDTAVVPISTVDVDNKTVRGLVVGESGGYKMVVLPAGSMGSNVALVAAKALELAK